MRPRPVWLHRFIVFTALSTLALITAGGLVTSHGVGMSVPDWPNTYGYNMFLFPFSQWVGGILYEHTHRLLGAWVGLLTTIMAAWMWVGETRGMRRWTGVGVLVLVVISLGIRAMPVYYTLASGALVFMALSLFLATRPNSGLRWWGMLAFWAVVLQGVLGGLRVVWLADEIGVFHATLAQLFFVLLCALALVTSRTWERLVASPALASPVPRQLAWLVGLTTLFILGQLVLGAAMRHQHAGLAIPDFPLAYGRIWPETDPDSVARYNQQRLELTALNPITAFQIQLQMAHRFMALVILGMVWACAWRARKTLGGTHPLSRGTGAWFLLVCGHAGLGAWTIWSNKAADIATLHVLGGVLTLALGGILSIVTFRKLSIAMWGVRFSNNVLTPCPQSSSGQ